MTSSYSEIYSQYLSLVTDYKYLQISEEDANAVMAEAIRMTLAKPSVRKLFSSVSFDEDEGVVTFEMNSAFDGWHDDSYNSMFVTRVLAYGVLVVWLSRRVYTTEIIDQRIGNDKQKFYSQSAHLEQMQSLLSSTRIGLDKEIRDYGYSALL